MYKEHDCVTAKKDLDFGIKKGYNGTIVCNPLLGPKGLYLVEFFDEEGNTINEITVNEQDIELRTHWDGLE